MDLGISGNWALVCASSKGLGRGCAHALGKAGVNLVINARSVDSLETTGKRLREEFPSIKVYCVAGDITDPSVRMMALKAAPRIDILITNAGGPPPGDFRNWAQDDWINALEANMLTPIELIKACVDDMASRGFGRILNITSAAVKSPIDILGLSNGARSGLTGFVAGLARQSDIASRNVTINNVLPGAFDTDRLQKTLNAVVESTNEPLEQIIARRLTNIPARRFGSVEEFGAVCAFLCSTQAGYLTGQNLLLDGGAYPGVL